jgi:hypothetical protein
MDSGPVWNMYSTLSNKSEKQCILLALFIRIYWKPVFGGKLVQCWWPKLKELHGKVPACNGTNFGSLVFCYKQVSLYKFNTWHPLTLCFLTFIIINSFSNWVYMELVTLIVAPLFLFLLCLDLAMAILVTHFSSWSVYCCSAVCWFTCALILGEVCRLSAPFRGTWLSQALWWLPNYPEKEGGEGSLHISYVYIYIYIYIYPICSLRWGYTSGSKSHTNEGTSCVREMSCNQNVISLHTHTCTHTVERWIYKTTFFKLLLNLWIGNRTWP